MTKAFYDPVHYNWLAFYVGRDGQWRFATDARGVPIACADRELAESVAAHRRSRLGSFQD